MDSEHNQPGEKRMQITSPSQFFFWQRWLFVISLAFIVFGLAIALLNNTPLFDLFNRQVDPVFWGSEAVSHEVLVFRGWIYGIAGSAIASWGVFLAYIINYPLRRREKWAWNCLVLGMLTWYFPDIAVSLYFGVFFNVIFSTLCVAAMIFPLMIIRKYFL